MFLFVLSLIVAFVIYAQWKRAQFKKRLEREGLNVSAITKTGKYLLGHPDIDKSATYTEVIPSPEKLIIVNTNSCKILGEIKKSEISDIAVADASTMERRVSLGALALVGVFAFAMKSKRKNELAYTTIKWNDGKFNHETIFEFTGQKAMQKANAARNAMIKFTR